MKIISRQILKEKTNTENKYHTCGRTIQQRIHQYRVLRKNMHLEKLNYATLLLVYLYNGLQVSRIPVSVFLQSDRVQIQILVLY